MKSKPPSPRRPDGLRVLLSALSVAALMALAGCGQDGGAPASPASDTGSRFVQVVGSGRVSADLDPLAKKPGSGGTTDTIARTTADAGGGPAIPGLTEPVTATDIVGTKRVSALLGGIITAGRHTLIIPAGALAQDTDIWVIDKTSTKKTIEVQLYPEGLHFARRVTLASMTVDLKNPKDLTWYWWNPTTALWDPIGGQVTIDGLGVFTWLEHFSTYRPGMMTGKAGW